MRAWLAQRGVRRTEPEFELRDAVGQPGCPICRLALRTAARQLDIVSYEAVNDLDLRARLRAARGFCNRHAWQFLEETRDPLGTALIYRDVVNTLVAATPSAPWRRPLAALRSRLPGPVGGAARPDRSLAGRLAPALDCPICQAQAETEHLYLRLLVRQLLDAAFARAWADSDGLCWPHLLRAIGLLGSGAPPLALLAQWLPGAIAEQPDDSYACLARHSAARLLARHFGRLQADRASLPPDLVVDLQRRRLDEVSRPGEPADVGCPVCRAIAPAPAGLALSGGPTGDDPASWCERHAWRGLAAGDAALPERLRRLTEERSLALEAASGHGERSTGSAPEPAATARRSGGEIASALRSGSTCPLCAEQAAAEAREASGSLSRLGAGETEESSAALCLPHLTLACAQPTGVSGPGKALDGQVAAWRRLSAELAEFARKHDYRFRDEPRGGEQSSPWRAVELIAGPRGATVGWPPGTARSSKPRPAR